jgi:hypothetical protein
LVKHPIAEDRPSGVEVEQGAVLVKKDCLVGTGAIGFCHSCHLPVVA